MNIDVLKDPMGTHAKRFGDKFDEYLEFYGDFFISITLSALRSEESITSVTIEHLKTLLTNHYGYATRDFAEFGASIEDGRWCSTEDDPDLDPLIKLEINNHNFHFAAYLYEYSFAAWNIAGQWYCTRID